MVMERPRNRAEDIRSYHLEYGDRRWPKDERLRQLVVQATNPQNHSIQVSILTEDQESAAVEVIRLMFNRERYGGCGLSRMAGAGLQWWE
jgi:hypothetical protein